MGLFDGFRRDKKSNSQDSLSQRKDYDKSLQSSYADNLTAEVVSEEQQPETETIFESPVETQESAGEVAVEIETSEEDQEDIDLPIYKTIKPYSEKNPVDHVIGTTRIIAVINQKGGVGKSTTAVNLSACLGEMGKSVLLVDLDPQGNASSGLGIEKSQVKNCVYDALLNDVPLEEIIIPDVCTRLDLVPATINLAGAEVELVSAMARENRLKDAVGRFRGKYDYIFIDCPPSLGLLTINSFVAADSLLIPIQTEFYALEGVTKLLESVKLVKARLNPSLDIFGVLLTMYDKRTNLAKQVADEVRNFFGNLVFETVIPRSVRLSEAPSFGQPITQFDPAGKGAIAYTSLAEEVIQRGNQN